MGAIKMHTGTINKYFSSHSSQVLQKVQRRQYWGIAGVALLGKPVPLAKHEPPCNIASAAVAWQRPLEAQSMAKPSDWGAEPHAKHVQSWVPLQEATLRAHADHLEPCRPDDPCLAGSQRNVHSVDCALRLIGTISMPQTFPRRFDTWNHMW